MYLPLILLLMKKEGKEFLDEIIASNFNKIRENKIIKGSQVPRFIKKILVSFCPMG